MLAVAAFAFQIKDLESLVVTSVHAMHLTAAWCCSLSQCTSRDIFGGFGVAPAVATYLRTVAAGNACAWGGVSEVLMLYCFHPASQSHCFSCSSNAFGRQFGAADASAAAMHFVGAFRTVGASVWPCSSAAALN